jgi:FMN reductase
VKSPMQARGSRTIAVVSAGLRQPSTTRLLADRLADAVVLALGEQGLDAELRTVEVREHGHDLVNMMATGFATPSLEDALSTVARADGLIAVTPIFSGSYTGMFKMFFDVLDDGALAGVPVLLGATAGTARHSLAVDHSLRPLFAYLRALAVPTGVFGATEDFGSVARPKVGSTDGSADAVPPIAERVGRAAGELAALVAARPERTFADPFDEPTPFERLLAGGS